MENNRNTRNYGLSLCGVCTVVFVILKLTGLIDWSWFWVLSPEIFSWGLVVVLLIAAAILKKIVDARDRTRNSYYNRY